MQSDIYLHRLKFFSARHSVLYNPLIKFLKKSNILASFESSSLYKTPTLRFPLSGNVFEVFYDIIGFMAVACSKSYLYGK